MANLRNSVLPLFRLLSLLALSNSIVFGSQWSEINAGLADTNILVLGIDPINPAIVYAGTSGGLYKSTNGGLVWSNIFLKGVESLAIDFINPNTLYAGTFVSGIGGPALFKSTDGGMNWSNRRSPSDYDFNLLVMDPTDPKILYIGSLWRQVGTGSMFFKKTRDGGETWVEMEKSWDAGVVVGCCTFAIDTSNPEIVYAPGHLYTSTSISGSAVLKSTDGGTSWMPTGLINTFTSAINPYFVNFVAIDPQNSNTLYAATYAYGLPLSGFTGLFKSTDAAKTWHPINTGLLNIGNDSHITAIVIDPDDPNVVYAATGGYRATDGQGVFKSMDGGKNWTVFNDGVDGLGALNIRSLALAPGSPNVLYAGTSAGVFKIIDGPVVTLNENVYCVGSPWTLTVSNTAAERSVRLLGTSNNRSWEIRDWRKTGPDGTKRENGVFATGTEGTHYLRVEVDGMLSNVVSFVVSNCRS